MRDMGGVSLLGLEGGLGREEMGEEQEQEQDTIISRQRDTCPSQQSSAINSRTSMHYCTP